MIIGITALIRTGEASLIGEASGAMYIPVWKWSSPCTGNSIDTIIDKDVSSGRWLLREPGK